MVLMVQGSYVSENEATAIAASIAVTSAINNNHKTLVMQLTDNRSLSALSILKGKEIAENTITELGSYQIEDKGIDALLRRANTIKLVKETFDASTEPMLSYENYLDIADITKKNDFMKTLSINNVKNILKYANEVYGMIIIILDGKNDQIMAEMLELCDAYLTCIKQGPAPHALNTHDDKKSYFAVADFDTRSKYNLQYMKKLYGSNNIYAIPYNSEYHDAVISGTLLRFMLKNNMPEKEDDNSKLKEAIIDLTDAIINDKKASDRKALEKLEDEMFISENELDEVELSEVSNFEIETVVTKRGHFLKRAVEEEVLHIDDSLPKKKSKKKPSFRKRSDLIEEILDETNDISTKEINEDLLSSEDDLLESDFEGSEILDENPNIIKKKKKTRGFFGRKKRIDAAEYDLLDLVEQSEEKRCLTH